MTCFGTKTVLEVKNRRISAAPWIVRQTASDFFVEVVQQRRCFAVDDAIILGKVHDNIHIDVERVQARRVVELFDRIHLTLVQIAPHQIYTIP